MQKSVYSKINYLISLLSMAVLGYLGWGYLTFCKGVREYSSWLEFYIDFMGRFELTAVSIAIVVIFCILASLQVLLMALSMGRKERYVDIDYGKIVEFNKVVLVLYFLYMIIVPVMAIIYIVF